MCPRETSSILFGSVCVSRSLCVCVSFSICCSVFSFHPIQACCFYVLNDSFIRKSFVVMFFLVSKGSRGWKKPYTYANLSVCLSVRLYMVIELRMYIGLFAIVHSSHYPHILCLSCSVLFTGRGHRDLTAHRRWLECVLSTVSCTSQDQKLSAV